MPVAHQYLHLIEYKDIETYNAINKIFRYVNDQEYEPTREQREIVEYLLKEFEKVHRTNIHLHLFLVVSIKGHLLHPII